MSNIGILAYGSLIEDPGIEIEPLILKRIENVKTPFRIEFARQSRTRSYAPTLTCVDTGGSHVLGSILILENTVTITEAENLLWRRETRQEGSKLSYVRPADASNKMIVEHLTNFNGLSTVIYTRLEKNIEALSGEILADLAIRSAKEIAGRTGKDGISYLISVKRQGIVTPLIKSYEREILRRTSTTTLEAALQVCLGAK